MAADRERFLEMEADRRRGQDEEMHLERALFPWLDMEEPTLDDGEYDPPSDWYDQQFEDQRMEEGGFYD